MLKKTKLAKYSAIAIFVGLFAVSALAETSSENSPAHAAEAQPKPRNTCPIYYAALNERGIRGTLARTLLPRALRSNGANRFPESQERYENEKDRTGDQKYQPRSFEDKVVFLVNGMKAIDATEGANPIEEILRSDSVADKWRLRRMLRKLDFKKGLSEDQLDNFFYGLYSMKTRSLFGHKALRSKDEPTLLKELVVTYTKEMTVTAQMKKKLIEQGYVSRSANPREKLVAALHNHPTTEMLLKFALVNGLQIGSLLSYTGEFFPYVAHFPFLRQAYRKTPAGEILDPAKAIKLAKVEFYSRMVQNDTLGAALVAMIISSLLQNLDRWQHLTTQIEEQNKVNEGLNKVEKMLSEQPETEAAAAKTTGSKKVDEFMQLLNEP